MTIGLLLSNQGWQDSPKSINLSMSLRCVMMLLGLRSKCAILYSFRYRNAWPIIRTKQILVLRDSDSLFLLMQSLRLGLLMQSTNRSFSQELSFSASRQYLGKNIDMPYLILVRMNRQCATLLFPDCCTNFLSSRLMMMYFFRGGVSLACNQFSTPTQYEPTYQYSISERQIVVNPPTLIFFSMVSDIFLLTLMQFSTKKFQCGIVLFWLRGSQSLSCMYFRYIKAKKLSYLLLCYSSKRSMSLQMARDERSWLMGNRFSLNLRKDSAYRCILSVRSCSSLEVQEARLKKTLRYCENLQICLVFLSLNLTWRSLQGFPSCPSHRKVKGTSCQQTSLTFCVQILFKNCRRECRVCCMGSEWRQYVGDQILISPVSTLIAILVSPLFVLPLTHRCLVIIFLRSLPSIFVKHCQTFMSLLLMRISWVCRSTTMLNSAAMFLQIL